MKLSKEDINCLLNVGYLKSDIPQIEEAISRSTYTLIKDDTTKEERLSVNEAICLLGRNTFLSGISRSAFHWSSCRRTCKGDTIYFDSSALFR